MDLEGRSCTLHPFAADGLVLPGNVDFGRVETAFYGAVSQEFARVGLGTRLAVDGEPDEEIVITGRFVQAAAGNRLKRYLAPFLADAAAIVEVEGVVTDRGVALEQFSVMGKRGLGPFGGAAQFMLNGAAEIAGRDAARKTIAILVG